MESSDLMQRTQEQLCLPLHYTEDVTVSYNTLCVKVRGINKRKTTHFMKPICKIALHIEIRKTEKAKTDSLNKDNSGKL
jgi:hypothetical protein